MKSKLEVCSAFVNNLAVAAATCDATQSAVLLRQIVCPSVCLSVTLRYRRIEIYRYRNPPCELCYGVNCQRGQMSKCLKF